jgi:hypothetical protein
MLDWIGSLRIRERGPARVVLGLSRSTAVAGVALVAAGAVLALPAWSLLPMLVVVPLALVAAGVLLVSLKRELVVDREAGTLRVEQRAFGLGSRVVVPLFHLRAVVVIARPAPVGPFEPSARFVAYLERRIGQAIYLDEARRCATLLRLAEAIADVAEVRLEYDAQASGER